MEKGEHRLYYQGTGKTLTAQKPTELTATASITPGPYLPLLENKTEANNPTSVCLRACMSTLLMRSHSIKQPLTFSYSTHVFDTGNMRLVWHNLNPTCNIFGVSIRTFGGMTTLLVHTLKKYYSKPQGITQPFQPLYRFCLSVTATLAGGSALAYLCHMDRG